MLEIKNISLGVVNIAEKFVLPKQTATIDDKWGRNSVFKGLVENNILAIVNKNATEEKEEEEVNLAEEFAKLGETPTLAKLKAFARKHKINISDAKDETEITAIIRASALLK